MDSPSSESLTRPPIIVLDTTAIKMDLWMTRSDMRQLLEFMQAGALRIAVPEVVVRESVRHQSNEAQAALTEAQRALDRVKAATGSRDDGIAGLNLDEIRKSLFASRDRYERDFRTKLSAVGSEVLSLPAVTHETLLASDLSRSKPFKENGSGYRDALIWHSVVELAGRTSDDQIIIFVSHNGADFGPARPKPQPDQKQNESGVDRDGLASQLLDQLPPSRRERVLRISTVKALLDSFREDFKRLSTSVRSVPETTRPSGHFKAGILSSIRHRLERAQGQDIAEDFDSYGRGLLIENIYLPRELDTPTLEYAEVDADSFEFEVVDTYEGGTQLWASWVEADVQIDGYLDKAEYYGSDEGKYSVNDGDWTNHSMWVSVERRVRFSLDLTVNPAAETVDDIELRDGEGVPAH